MSDVRRAILYSSFSHYSLRALNLVSIMTFARLLTPGELGLFAIASSVSFLVSEFRLLGASNFVVREKTLTPDLLKSALGLTMVISWTLGISLIALSGRLSLFYKHDDLASIFQILSIGFFFAPFISLVSSLLSRNLDYRRLFIIRFFSQGSSFAVSLLLVLTGFSYFSLAWGIMAGVLVEFSLSIRFAPDIMQWSPRFKGIAPIARFGIYSSLTGLCNRFTTTGPDLIIGKLGTTSEVAIFSRALGFLDFLTQLLVMGIKPVSLPYLSQVKRDSGDLAEAYVRAAVLLGVVCLPVLSVASAVGFPIIRLFFGDQWDASVPVVSILAIWAVFRSIHTLSSNLLISSSNEGLMLLKESVIFLVTLVSVTIAYPFGLTAMAWGMAISGLVEFLVNSWSLKKAIGLSLFSFVSSMRSNLIISVVCWGVTHLIDSLVHFETRMPLLSIGIVAAILPVIWLSSVFVLNHPVRDEIGRMWVSLKTRNDSRGN